MLTNEIKYLIYLLYCAFNDISPKPDAGIDYKELIKQSQRHQVYNIIIPLISDFDCISDDLKKLMRDYKLTEITKMIAVNNDRQAIYDKLEKNGIRYMPLKGLLLKNYYPLESMRQMSDSDILIERVHRESVLAFMKSMGFTIQETLGNSDDYYKQPYSTVEFHFELFFDKYDFCPTFDNVWQNATPDGDGFRYKMGLDDLYLHSVCHMYKHYISAGCGIRFLADMYLFLRKEKDNLNWAFVNSYLDKYGILEYERKSRALAFKIFENKTLDEVEEQLLDTFVSFGIFGTQDNKIKNDLNELGDGLSLEKKKKKYLLNRLFPKKEEMVLYHKVLKDKPYLLPWYYVKRLFSAIFNFKKFKSEYDSVKNIK